MQNYIAKEIEFQKYNKCILIYETALKIEVMI